jgi:hypothetical protein
MCQGFLEWLCGSSCVMTLGILRWWVRNVFHPKEKIPAALWELQGFWKGDTREYNILHSLILFWIFVQTLKGIMWNCWVGLCGVSIVGYELPFLWSNTLTPREEIKSEIDPLWSIEIRQQFFVSIKILMKKWLETNLSILVKLQQYTLVPICSTLGFIQWRNYFPFLLVTLPSSLPITGSLLK